MKLIKIEESIFTSFGISVVLSFIASILSAMHSYAYCTIHCQGEATFAINADGVGDARD